MKRRLFTFALAALTIGLLGSCSKINERIDGLDKRVYDLENNKIASVEQQITAINTSINELKAADVTINGKIDELKQASDAQQTLIDALKAADQALGQKDDALEARIAALEGQVTTINGQIDALVNADIAINTRIDQLKSYVDTEIGKAKDWATATFATLTQYQQTADDLAALSVTVTGISTTLAEVQTSITGLDAKIDGIDAALQDKITTAKTELEGNIADLKTELEGKIAEAIATSETGLKSWVNEQLSGYYTAAQVDAEITDLQNQINTLKTDTDANKTKIEELETSLAKLKADLDAAKTTIKSEYEAAIAKAISDNNGTITQTIQTKIDEVNATIANLTGRVETLESDVATLKNDVAALKAMIQTVSIIPAYSNGSLKAEDGILTINCVITPKEAVESLTKENFTILTSESEVLTKSALYGTLTIAKDEDLVLDKTNGTATIKVDVSSALPAEEDKALTIAVNIKNGISDFTTEFVPVYVAGPAIPAALPGVFSVSATKKVHFSKGNLWADSNNALHFEDAQWKSTPVSDGSKDANHVSHFTWSSTVEAAVGNTNSGDNLFCDESNKVSVDGSEAIYYALSKDEWTYLINSKNDETIRKSKYKKGVTVCDKESCLILVPDECLNGYSFDNTKTNYTADEWATAEAAGLVCLPAAGSRDGSGVSNVGFTGSYWSSTAYNIDQGYNVIFNGFNVSPNQKNKLRFGCSVRLITESDGGDAPEVKVTGVTLNKTELSLAAGKSETLVATVQPEDATNKNVIWTSDNTGVATVGSTDGKVTAVAEGTATITAIVDGLFTATCTVTVKGLPAGALSGEFSVSATKQVHFSQGNLVATIDASGAPTAWKFAANQYDYIGEGGANKTIGVTAGDVDLFGWSTSTNGGTSTTNNCGIKTSTTASDYSGDFYDWGKAYCVSKSISPDNTWRTLSDDEWKYLFKTRTMANEGDRYEDLMSSGIEIQGVLFKGVVLFPDNFTEQATWKDTYTTWEALNNAGLVFLPAAGLREASDVRYTDDSKRRGYYWSSSAPILEELPVVERYFAYREMFTSGAFTQGQADCYYGHSVRLITE